jgi:hypothetical protein
MRHPQKDGAMVDELPIVDSDPNSIAATQAEYEQLAACGAMLAAEGPNEPNNLNFNFNYNANAAMAVRRSPERTRPRLLKVSRALRAALGSRASAG